jgi:hypothetical protein
VKRVEPREFRRKERSTLVDYATPTPSGLKLKDQQGSSMKISVDPGSDIGRWSGYHQVPRGFIRTEECWSLSVPAQVAESTEVGGSASQGSTTPTAVDTFSIPRRDPRRYDTRCVRAFTTTPAPTTLIPTRPRPRRISSFGHRNDHDADHGDDQCCGDLERSAMSASAPFTQHSARPGVSAGRGCSKTRVRAYGTHTPVSHTVRARGSATRGSPPATNTPRWPRTRQHEEALVRWGPVTWIAPRGPKSHTTVTDPRRRVSETLHADPGTMQRHACERPRRPL